MFDTKFDALSEIKLKEEALAFFAAATDKSAEADEVIHSYNSLLPRVNFVKNVESGATLLDLGAGEGGVVNYKAWPLGPRKDLRMLALSLTEGSEFHKYDAFDLKDFEKDDSIFPEENINTVICCHFIEHMSDPRPTIEFLSRRMARGGRVYMEWPHEISNKMPTYQFFIENGINISTTRFDDDCTHVKAWNMEIILDLIKKSGFSIETAGRVFMPYASSRLRDISVKENDIVGNTLAFWSYFGWPQYFIATRN